VESSSTPTARHPACDEAHFANFVQAVRSRRSSDLHAEIEEGHFSSGLSHLANISYRLGETLPASEVRKRLEHATMSNECLEGFDRLAQHLKKNELDPDTTPLQFGPALTIDNHSESFTGPDHAKANQLLTREYRKGYEIPSSIRST
jgi:hypothetical protein